MRELAADRSVHAIGCTQVSEILYTAGVQLVRALPPRFELRTEYTAAVGARTAQPQLVRRFISWLAGPQSEALRLAGGFDA